MEDKPSRGDRLLEELKAKRKRAGQFGLGTLLGLTFLVAVLLAVAKGSGEPATFFMWLYLIAYAAMPVVAYAFAGLLPGLSALLRQRVMFGLAGLIAMPLPLWLALGEGAEDGLALLAGSLVWWGAQVLLLTTLHRALFRD